MFYQILGATDTGDADLFAALGIDWRLLIIQIVAFVILVALLKKFVYPPFIRSIDARQKSIEDAHKAGVEAQKQANQSKLEIEELLSVARKEAADIVSTAKDEATDILENSEKKARNTAERIVADAQAEIEREVESAKKELHNQTLDLVALATEKVIGKVHASKADSALIADTLKEIK